MNERYIVVGIVQYEDSVAIGKKAKGRPPYPDVWHTPGGGVDDKEKAAQLVADGEYDAPLFHEELQREISEELHCEIANIQCIIPQYRSGPREAQTKNKHGELTHYHFIEYLCDYAGGTLAPGDDLAEAVWAPKDQLSQYTFNEASEEMYKELGWLQGGRGHIICKKDTAFVSRRFKRGGVT